jgi:hypothetical protein
MKLIDRPESCIDFNSNYEILYNFDNFPIFMGITEQKPKSDLFETMEWIINKKNGMIQLKKLIPLNVLYSNTHTPGTVGKIWEKHHKKFSNFIKKSEPISVFEIGGNSGLLAQNYLKSSNVNWTIVDPAAKKNNLNIKIIKDFFRQKNKISKLSDVIHSHTFEHIYYPHKFINLISKKISMNRSMIFSVPNIKAMLINKYTNALNFEHTFYLNEEVIEFYLKYYGFAIKEKKYFLKDHSIFYRATKVSKITPIKFEHDQYNENKILFMKFVNFYKDEVKFLNNKINAFKGEVFLFGAHIFSQFLISFGLNSRRINSVLDNDLKKIDKRLYGTNLIVNLPNIISKCNNCAVILRAGVYNNEIKKGLNKINQNITFL